MTKTFKLGISLLALSYASSGTTAYAQLTDEIVVTATKKSTNLQETAVSVTAYTGEAIQKLGLENSVSLAAQTPGLNVGTPVGEGNNPSFTLRGVGLNDFNDNNEGPIAVYTDEVYNAALPGLTFQLFDVDRVEVLRGPQGTLYGRNATGGLLHFISKRGGDEFEADIRAQYGRFNSIELEGGFGGPISDAGHYRIAGKLSNSDGYVENRIGNDSNENGSYTVRGIVDFDIEENANLEFKLDYSNADTRAPYYQHTSLGFPIGVGVEGPEFGPDRFRYEDTDGDNFAGDYDNDDISLEIEAWGASANLDWDIGGIQLTNIAAYREVDKFHAEEADTGPFRGLVPTFQSQSSQFSNEFRLSGDTGPLSWVAGAYYINTTVDGQLDLDINDRGPGFAEFLQFLTDVGDPTGLPTADILGFHGTSFADFAPDDLVRFLTYDIDYTQNTDSISVFGNVEYDLSDKLQLVVGGRYSNESRDIEYVNQFADGPLGGGIINTFFGTFLEAPSFFDFSSGGGSINLFTFEFDEVGDLNQIDDDDFSGTIGLNYTLEDGTLLYAKVAQGFKSGGFNAGFLDFTDGVTVQDIAYDAEKLTSYEGGVKWTSAGGNVRANVSAFYYDYKNYQALTFAGLSQFIQNSDATFYGGEAEIGATLTDGFTVQLGASYVDTSVDQVGVRQGDGSVVSIQDVSTVLAPEFTANGIARYETKIGSGVGSLQVSFNHQGNHFFNLQNTNQEDAYTLFDARAGYAFGADENMELYIFGKNLTDKEYRVYSFNFADAAGFQQEFYGRPREYGVGLIAKF
ncbi:iron complex outermembrane receptor protein [Litorimonas taeanensis]|uniref:Iron complex outermembrane receptor protein n=1 Tax=Litorimonas taeanensis TaxID=568099 RepID=A0A420WJL1_9PROT|nr:TonB-dependent receptor [Litorimonas taeanensis]RKQ71200.1 iron complex outermembrane receptor protein [Litorimonas taeanensis]